MRITEVNRVKPATLNKRIHVAVAVIWSPCKTRILIAKRTSHQHLAGLWEFPGGKVESGEKTEQAVVRELKEELAIDVSVGSLTPLIKIPYNYPDKQVLLDVMEVHDFSGNACGNEGQIIDWVRLQDLDLYEFPSANATIISALQLPRQYLISGSWLERAGDAEQFEKLDQQLSKLELSNSMIQWRQPDMYQQSPERYRQLALRWLELAQAHQCKLLLNTDLKGVELMGADGLHLPFREVKFYTQRPISEERYLGISCHSLKEVETALMLSPDFICLSPVNPTDTHPEMPILGWEKFQDWLDEIPVPVYGLGGLRMADLPKAQRMGAQGVACIGDWWPL
jgi:8-oxo-dGTP diphosphatase